jgi:hypothetical protein
MRQAIRAFMLIYIVFFILSYLATSFIVLDFNMLDWSIKARGTFVMAWAICGTIAFVAYSNSDYL